jgi:two-component system sensor kinase FixL
MAIMTNAGALQKILDRREPIPDEAREIVADILKDDRRAADIIRHMRRFLRSRELVNGAVDVNELVAETVRLVGVEAATRNVRVRLEPHKELPCVVGDRVLLQQVMMNLVLNALEAMTQAPEDARWLTIRTGSYDGAVTIDVRDSGTGIPNEQLARLFEPFQSAKKDGLGIGLSITRAIVDAHGGRISAENNADGGATFHVALRTAGPAQTLTDVLRSA